MATADPTVELIESLDALKARLSSGQDPGARKEALEISKKLSASLADPGNVAVELIFSVWLAWVPPAAARPFS